MSRTETTSASTAGRCLVAWTVLPPVRRAQPCPRRHCQRESSAWSHLPVPPDLLCPAFEPPPCTPWCRRGRLIEELRQPRGGAVEPLVHRHVEPRAEPGHRHPHAMPRSPGALPSYHPSRHLVITHMVFHLSRSATADRVSSACTEARQSARSPSTRVSSAASPRRATRPTWCSRPG